MLHLTSKRFGLLGVLLAAAMLAAPVSAPLAQTVTVRASGDPQVTQLRLAALGFIEKGQWASATAGIEQLLTTDPQDPIGLELRRLMVQQQRMEKVRQTQRQAAYAESAGKVAGHMAAQAWEEALGEATRAADLSPGKAELHKEPWFPGLIEKAVQSAEQHREKGEWLKATALYSQIAVLFEREDNQYRDLAKKLTRYARFEAVYRDREDAERAIKNVDENMMAAALEQVRRFYVREPDYRKMTVNALDCLIAMGEVPTMVKPFPSLGEKEQTARMRRDLADLRDKLAARDKVGLQELARAYLDAKRVIGETVGLPEGVIIREFLDGALDELDNFSSMIWPSEKGEFEKSMRGAFSGVGIQISLEDGRLTVVTPLEDTPAYRAGIQVGDVITAIDGESTEKITLNQAVQKITGEAGTAVVLTIRRLSLTEPRDFRLVRDNIQIKTVKGFLRDKASQWDYLIDPDYRIGYVRVTNYMPQTVDELEQAMDAMATIPGGGVRGLIIDLRFNPGGLLGQAVEMSDLFIDQGVIVSTEGRASRRDEQRAHSGATNTALPLIVLVNDYSASAAEIVAGALKDSGRATILGDRTFGKGSVQTVIPVGANGGAVGAQQPPAYLKLTTAYYYLPGGESIHRHEDSKTWGVEPTVAVKVTRDEVQDILDLRRDSDVIHQPGEASTTQPDESAGRPTTQPDHVRQDPQMETALLVMRAELLRKRM